MRLNPVDENVFRSPKARGYGEFLRGWGEGVGSTRRGCSQNKASACRYRPSETTGLRGAHRLR